MVLDVVHLIHMQNEIRIKFKEIQKILSEEWDPIPGSPTDEYDDYVNRIISLHSKGELNLEKLTQYLVSLEEGFSHPVDVDVTKKIAEKLLNILENQILVNEIGRIEEGEYKGWYTKIVPSTLDGDWLILGSSTEDFKSDESFDYWAEDDKLPIFFKELGWKVEWLTNSRYKVVNEKERQDAIRRILTESYTTEIEKKINKLAFELREAVEEGSEDRLKEGILPKRRDPRPIAEEDKAWEVVKRLIKEVPKKVYASGQLERYWDFPAPENAGCFSLKKIVFEDKPVLHVNHDKDGDWQFLGLEDADETDIALVHVSHLLDKDSTLTEISDLPRGWHAWREEIGGKWTKEIQNT